MPKGVGFLSFMITAAKRTKIGYTKYTHIFGHLAANQKSRWSDVLQHGVGTEIFVAMRERFSAKQRVVIIKCGASVLACVFFMI